MNLSALSYNWFDLAVVILLAIGVLRGRSRGMSEELLDLLKWLGIVVLGGMAYQPIGGFLADYTHMALGASYVFAYFIVLILMRLLFSWIKRMAGEKLVGGDVFGNGEYYLGMLAGAVRFACYIVVGMALLNAYYVSPEDMAANARMQQENFGDISFPTIGRVQQIVFNKSASGKLVKRYLAQELIVSTASGGSTAPAETLGRQRERIIYEALGEKK
jgi:uncharacterized membrane protein required for colicin V production